MFRLVERCSVRLRDGKELAFEFENWGCDSLEWILRESVQ
jgi:hypothetical protein